MNFYFLPPEIREATDNLNVNFLSEIRLRRGQPVIIQYRGEYMYINKYSPVAYSDDAIVCKDPASILSAALDNSVYAYTEQLKNGYVTVGGGVRIGIGGEYVVQGGCITTVKNVTSLNIRIPHDAVGCAREIYGATMGERAASVLIFSPPGYGKTTLLRDMIRQITADKIINALIFDERNELTATDGTVSGFDLGACCDVIRGADKLTAFANSVRVMQPNVIICDELYGERDLEAVSYAISCGITLVASTHVTDKERLKNMPFDYFVGLTGIGKRAIVYDKAFNTVCHCNTVGSAGDSSLQRKKA